MVGPYFSKLLLFLSFDLQAQVNTINHFHRLHGQPEATDLFFYCPTFFEKVKKNVDCGVFNFFDVQNATDEATSFLNLVLALFKHLSSSKRGRGRSYFLILTLSINPI